MYRAQDWVRFFLGLFAHFSGIEHWRA
jgi:hypothetical protein